VCKEQSNPTLFEIVGIKTMPVPMYILKSYDEENDTIEGGFYDSELTLIDFNEFVIERTMKERPNKVLVKWVGLPHKYNSWLPKEVFDRKMDE
jgi:hypothetical protein